MTTIRRFDCNDLLRFASVNLDRLAVTLGFVFYARMELFYFKEEDGIKMRKLLSRDTEEKSLRPPGDKTSRAPPGELYTASDDEEVIPEDEY